MAIERRTHRTVAKSRALRDFTERRVVLERGGDVLRLEDVQMEALQTFLASWPEDEKLLFLRMYVEEVLHLEQRVLQRAGRKRGVADWLSVGFLLLLTLLLISSRK